MTIYEKWKESRYVALIAIFASFNAICDSLVGPPLFFSGVWYSWVFISEPITGIILGPFAGFFSSFIGVMVGHFVYFRGTAEFLFTLGAPIGTMISAFVFRGKWKLVLLYYSVLLGAYFATPVAWSLPIWGIWDVLVAFGLVLLLVPLVRRPRSLWNVKSKTRLFYILALSTFIGLEADVLFRIFVFIPCQSYQWIYGIYDLSSLQTIWALGALETSTKAAISTIVTAITGPPIVAIIRKMGFTHLAD